MRSAMYWSSEIVLRNELLAGCGAAVRKLMSDGWPPSTLGCDTPLNTVKSAAVLLQALQIRRRRVVAASVRGEKLLRQQPRLLQMPNIRRGVAFAAGMTAGESARASGVIARATAATARRPRRAETAAAKSRRRAGPNGGERAVLGMSSFRARQICAGFICSETTRSARSHARSCGRRTGRARRAPGSLRSPADRRNRTGAPVAIDHQLLREIARDRRLVLQQQLLEFPDVGERAAIGQLPAESTGSA